MRAGSGHLEQEVKLGVSPRFTLPDLEGVLGLRATLAPDQRLDAVYVDTPDLRLARSGLTLRHRSGEGWTLKVPEGDAGPEVLSRRELTVAGDIATVPAELAGLVTAWVRTSSLAPVAHLRTVRRRLLLSDGEGTAVAEVVDDDVSVLHGEHLALRFREVEVELAAGAPAVVLDEVVGRLRMSGAGAADAVPKVMRALGPRATEPPELVGAAADEGAESAAAVILSAVKASVRCLLRHDLGARLGGAGDVDQARVATRRLRSDLRTFAPLLDQGWSKPLRAELAWLAAALGDVSDAEAMVARLRAAASRLPSVDAEAAIRLNFGLESAVDKPRERLSAVLDDPRYAALLDRLVSSVEAGHEAEGAPEWLARGAEAPAAVVPALVRRPWKRLRTAARAAMPDASDDALRQVGVRAERCRYAAEAVAPLIGAPATRLASALADVERVLSDLHDAVVAEDWLRSLAPALDPAQGMVAGQLVAGQRAAAEISRGAWSRAWRRVDRGKLRAWLTG